MAASRGSARRSSATYPRIQHGCGFGDDEVAAPSTWQRVERRPGDIYSNDCVQTEQWWWALDQVAVVADQLSSGWSWSCAWCSVLTFRWARRFFGGQHLSRGEVCVPATSCAFLCVTPRAQPPVFSLFPSQWPPKVSLHLFRACTVAELRFRFASPCFLRVCLSYRPALCSEPHA